MAVYPSQSGGGIGALLRLIQEERSSSLAGLPPQTEAGSPLRGTIQEPLKSPEAQGTTRVVSLRPEGVTAQQGEIIPEVVAPAAPPIPTPVPTPAQPSPQGPSTPSSQPSYTASPSMPSIGTKLVSSLVSKVLGTTTKKASTPAKGVFTTIPSPLRWGAQMVNPAPTPTPSQREVEKTTPSGLIPKKTGGFYRPTTWGRA